MVRVEPWNITMLRKNALAFEKGTCAVHIYCRTAVVRPSIFQETSTDTTSGQVLHTLVTSGAIDSTRVDSILFARAEEILLCLTIYLVQQ